MSRASVRIGEDDCVQVFLGGFGVEIKLTDEGIVVDVLNTEDDLVATTWALNDSDPLVDPPLQVSLSPEAIREHYEGADDMDVDGWTDDDLQEVALIALGQDVLWRGFSEALDQAVMATRRNRRVAFDPGT